MFTRFYQYTLNQYSIAFKIVLPIEMVATKVKNSKTPMGVSQGASEKKSQKLIFCEFFKIGDNPLHFSSTNIYIHIADTHILNLCKYTT